MCQKGNPITPSSFSRVGGLRRPHRQGIVSIKVSLQSLDWFTYKLGHDSKYLHNFPDLIDISAQIKESSPWAELLSLI